MKTLTGILLIMLITSCESNTEGEGSGRERRVSGDTVNSSPSAIDTVQHPNGITSGSVISRDTAAMRADTTQRDK